jgi:hypothetical protein
MTEKTLIAPEQVQVDAMPCPFCGGINIVREGFHLCCWACGADGPDADTGDEESLIAAWNRRAVGGGQQAPGYLITEATRTKLEDVLLLAADGHVGQEDFRDALTILAALPAAVETVPQSWMPIETAPKDGRRVMLTVEGYVGHRGPFSHPDSDADIHHLARWTGEYWEPFIPNNWTHWAALPEPASASAVPQPRQEAPSDDEIRAEAMHVAGDVHTKAGKTKHVVGVQNTGGTSNA